MHSSSVLRYFDQDGIGVGQEQLYFFQFPYPLPKFLSKSALSTAAKDEQHPAMDVNGQPSAASTPAPTPHPKHSTPGGVMTPTPSGAATPAHVKKEEAAAEAGEKVDGVVGQLEIYKSGKVKMRIGKDIVLDVSFSR